MTLPTNEPLPPENNSLPPARKRRQQRTLPADASSEERAAFLHEISRRVTPSIDFYLFNLLAGAILFLAILLDSPALYILVVLLAPFMAPVAGMSLAISMGSLGFFLRSFIVTLIGGAIYFLSGLGAGIIAHRFPAASYLQVFDHNVFSWPDLVVLAIGAVLTALLLVRSRQRALVASVALVYELYVPLGMAGFGLTSGISGLFPDGILVFAIHLISAVLIGAITLALAGFRPRKVFGFVLTLLLILAAVFSVVYITGLGASILLPKPPAEPTVQITTAQPTSAAEIPTATLAPSVTSEPTLADTPVPTSAATATRTLEPSPTPTQTLTPQPTPVWAKVFAAESDGANVRAEPSYSAPILATVLNESMVQVLTSPVNKGGVYWVTVRTESGIEGWMVQFLLITATPAPGW